MPTTLTCGYSISVEDGVCATCGHEGLVLVVRFRNNEGSAQTDSLCENCAPTPRGSPITGIAMWEPNVGTCSVVPTKAVKRKSQRRERALAEALGGRRQPASGALPHAKGDVRKRGEWRIDDKMTKQKSFPLSKELFAKVRSECTYPEKPAMVIAFLDPISGEVVEEVAVVDINTFKEMASDKDR